MKDIKRHGILQKHGRFARASLLAAALLVVVVSILPAAVSAQFATILDRSVKLSNNIPGQTATYVLSFSAPAVPTLGSIKAEFCSSSPIFDDPCVAPAGFSLSSAALTAQTGEGGFTIHASSTANTLVLSRPPSPSTGGTSTFDLTGVINASTTGTQYVRYSTYAADDGTGTMLDRGGLAYVLNDLFGVSTEVPPYLDFCLGTTIVGDDCTSPSGDYVLMGDFTATNSSDGQVQLGVATNAPNGYAIAVQGNTLASGTNALPALGSPTASQPGSNQFGINLRSNIVGGADPSGPGNGAPTSDYAIANRYVFRNGDVVANNAGMEAFRKYTVTYLVNISDQQPAGIYSGTYTYIALGNF